MLRWVMSAAFVVLGGTAMASTIDGRVVFTFDFLVTRNGCYYDTASGLQGPSPEGSCSLTFEGLETGRTYSASVTVEGRFSGPPADWTFTARNPNDSGAADRVSCAGAVRDCFVRGDLYATPERLLNIDPYDYGQSIDLVDGGAWFLEDEQDLVTFQSFRATLDNVSRTPLVAAPLPSSASLAGGIVAAGLLVLRRRRSRAAHCRSERETVSAA